MCYRSCLKLRGLKYVNHPLRGLKNLQTFSLVAANELIVEFTLHRWRKRSILYLSLFMEKTVTWKIREKDNFAILKRCDRGINNHPLGINKFFLSSCGDEAIWSPSFFFMHLSHSVRFLNARNEQNRWSESIAIKVGRFVQSKLLGINS